MSSWPWLAMAALLAVLFVWWAYVRREEQVLGRAGPAVLRALALSLLVAGLALPPLSTGRTPATERVAVLDLSRSMALPARPPAAGAGADRTRLDSARTLLRSIQPDRVYTFGPGVRSLPLDSAAVSSPTGSGSRVADALEAARLAGADSVWLLTDGELDDRAQARRVAERLELGVRELPVATPVGRVGLDGLHAPARARSGDTLRLEVDVVSGGTIAPSPDSLELTVREDGRPIVTYRVPVPSPGRRSRVRLAVVPTASDEASGWRYYEVALPDGADPLERAARRGAWVEVGAEITGAVLLSTDLDWEPRFLLPVLERAILGGARGFVRVDEARFVEIGAEPRRVDAAGAIERAIRSARLVVLHGRLDRLPEWAERALGSRGRRLLLPRGPGPVRGTPVARSGPRAGQWYATAPTAPGPTFGLIPADGLETLPPLEAAYEVNGAFGWVPLAGRRGRRGQASPLFVAGTDERGRFAVAAGEGYWRWAARGGVARRTYEGLFAGVVGWLVEEWSAEPLALLGEARPGIPISWRLGARATELRIHVSAASEDPEETGEPIWARSWLPGAAEPMAPGDTLQGPSLPPGRYLVVVRGVGPEGALRDSRPLELVDEGEMRPRAPARPLIIAGRARGEGGSSGPRTRPAWPFAAAAFLLCVEWTWRKRIGLR